MTSIKEYLDSEKPSWHALAQSMTTRIWISQLDTDANFFQGALDMIAENKRLKADIADLVGAVQELLAGSKDKPLCYIAAIASQSEDMPDYLKPDLDQITKAVSNLMSKVAKIQNQNDK